MHVHFTGLFKEMTLNLTLWKWILVYTANFLISNGLKYTLSPSKNKQFNIHLPSNPIFQGARKSDLPAHLKWSPYVYYETLNARDGKNVPFSWETSQRFTFSCKKCFQCLYSCQNIQQNFSAKNLPYSQFFHPWEMHYLYTTTALCNTHLQFTDMHFRWTMDSGLYKFEGMDWTHPLFLSIKVFRPNPKVYGCYNKCHAVV